MRPLVLALWAAALTAAAPLALAGPIATSVDASTLSQGKRTELGLYLTATDAGRALEADPGIVFVDVRSRAEFQFVGHPSLVDANIPIRIFDPENAYNGKSAYGMRPNPDFVAGVDRVMARAGLTKADTVFVMCRSGGRSAAAANALAKAGYTDVWSIVDGFEGGKAAETGHRTVTGWRNSGLPWGYRVTPDLVYREGG